MPPKMKFADGEKVLCFHGPLLYEAKCVKFEVKDKINRYFIHYNGWNKNWDEWVPESRVLKCNESGLQKQKELLKAHIGAKKAKAAAKKLERERERERSSTPTSDKPKKDASDKQKPSERGKEKISSEKSKKGAENEKQKGGQSDRGKTGAGSEKQKASDKQKTSAAEKKSTASEKQKTSAADKQKLTISTERQKAVSEKQKEKALAAAEKEKTKAGTSTDKKQKEKNSSDKVGAEKATEKISSTPTLLSSQDSLASSQSSSGSTDQLKRKRKADSSVESPDLYLGKIEVKIKIPDELKPWLVDDWDLVTRQKQLVSLPCRITVSQLLEDYYKSKIGKGTNVNKDAILEVTNGIKEYFNVMLGTHLLYKFERPQYSDVLTEHTDKPQMCDIYGPVHLLRLFVKLGSLLPFTSLDDKCIQLLQTHINDFLKYMAKNLSSMFSLHDYIVASPEYHRKAI